MLRLRRQAQLETTGQGCEGTPSRQLECDSWAQPTKHVALDVAPVKAEKVPAMQKLQSLEEVPANDKYVPAGQLSQVAELLAPHASE